MARSSLRPKGLPFSTYQASVHQFMDNKDIIGGLFKSVIFGVIVALIGCREGMQSEGGAAGVGQSTDAFRCHVDRLDLYRELHSLVYPVQFERRFMTVVAQIPQTAEEEAEVARTAEAFKALHAAPEKQRRKRQCAYGTPEDRDSRFTFRGRRP